MTTKLPVPGDDLHGFRVRNRERLDELNATLIQLDHIETGARWVHLQNEDPNNLFAVAFRTPPSDSTGIAHILEHTVLCGSRRYPVRDPFFAMLKRSLNTFMNALTSSDWTAYPFATQNRKDFQNLMGIYLDAAFFPLLRENDFLQEGHRLEFSDPANPESPLEYKGVVYNEMKGAMASPSSLLYRRLGNALYPTTCYRFNSGGEPSVIPDLTWEELKTFHGRYYHPSNAWFYSYGDMPLEAHLAAVEEQVMTRFSRLDIDSVVPPEQRLDMESRLTEHFPIDPGEDPRDKTLVQTAWLTCNIEESFTRLTLNLLSMLLLGNPAAPLHKALLDSRLGGNLAPGSGYQDDNRTTYFAAGLQATEPERTGQIEDLIFETLRKTARDGFRKDRVEGVIHRLEFGQREVTGDRYPYALGLLMRIMGPWLHADDPVSVLRLEDHLDRLRRETAKAGFFPDLIERYLLENRHRVTLTLTPDPEMQHRKDAAVTARLKAVAANLSPGEKEKIVLKAEELKRSQESPEDISCLPTLEISDIPEREPEVPRDSDPDVTVDTQWFDQPTNGIGYFTAHLPVSGLSPGLFPFLPLYCNLATQVGAAGRSYTEMAEETEAHTGGIHLNTEILDDPDRPDRYEVIVGIRAKALNRKQDQLFRIVGDYLVAPDFDDVDRIRTVLLQMKTSLENAIPGSGHLYAARAGAAHLSPAASLREKWSGISLLHLVRSLTSMDQRDLTAASGKFRAIADFLVDRGRIRCAVTGEKQTFAAIRPHLERFSERLPSATVAPSGREPDRPTGAGRFGWATSVPVSYVTRTYRTVPYSHPDTAHLLVLAKVLRSGYLHREIREKGGAYGGMASCNNEGGLFSLLSYRDPHILRTLNVYDEAAAWAAEGKFTDEAIKEAQLSVFADLDRPLSPGGRGAHEFANLRQGLTLEKRQELRQRILATTRNEIERVARHYLVENERQVDSIVSNEERLLQARERLTDQPFNLERI